MKKILVICFALLIAASMSVSAFAENGGFISSPTGKPAPVLVEATNQSDECVAEVIVTAYGDRDSLDAEAREELEDAYATIVDADNLSELNKKIPAIARDQGTKTANLAVSDLFDISFTDCGDHAEHGVFDLVMEAEALKDFVCLLAYEAGTWSIVDDAKIVDGYLEFSLDKAAPLAIVLDTDAAEGEEESGSVGPTETIVGITAVIAAANACATTYLIISSKEKRK